MCKVRCVDCGFLAVRDKETRLLSETEIEMRQTWSIPSLVDPPRDRSETFGARMGRFRYEQTPICFAGAAELRVEIGEIRNPQPDPLSRVAIFAVAIDL